VRKARREEQSHDAAEIAAMTDEQLEQEMEIWTEEIALGLRNSDGSAPAEQECSDVALVVCPPKLDLGTPRYGESLARWLNESKGTDENLRVCAVMASFAAVRATITGYSNASHITDEWGRIFSGRMPNEVLSGDQEYRRLISGLRRKLRQYLFFPGVECPLERQWVGSWEPTGQRSGRKRYFTEHDAIRCLYETSLDGELERLRKCKCGCGVWFFASRSDKHFIGDHRQKSYRSSADFKRHRAGYMSRYRRQQKMLDEKALERVAIPRTQRRPLTRPID
jgi:hypothetical protein